jgi:hypothetical protein
MFFAALNKYLFSGQNINSTLFINELIIRVLVIVRNHKKRENVMNVIKGIHPAILLGEFDGVIR